MSTITSILGTDQVTNSRAVTNTNFSNLNTDKAETNAGLSQFSATTSAQLASVITDETGSGSLVFATGPTLITPKANNFIPGFTTTATAAGTTTLTASSTYNQVFTGATTQTCVLPVASTLTTGHSFLIENDSSGLVTVQSSGGNVLSILPQFTTLLVICKLASGTDTNSWNWDFRGYTITSGKKLSVSNTLTLAGTDGTTMTFPPASASIGYLCPVSNPQSGAYPIVLTDAGKSIDHPATDANARTFTIPANGSIPFPVGTELYFTNMTANVVTIAITSDTMYLSPAGTTGSRSLAQYGQATARKLTSTTWLVWGSGLT